MNEEKITYFGQTDARNKKVTFGIKAKDRTKHVYVIGKTGMGKSTVLENMAVQDIKNGEGMAFIDPHGKTAELLLEYVPENRQKDVVYFAPFDMDYPISFNVLESVDPDKRHLVVSGLMSTFKKIWQDAWSARMEYILTNTLLALLEYPDATLLGVNRMLSDKEFRKHVISYITDPSVKSFWVQEFANYTERMAAEAIPAIQNKIGQFTANALIRNIIGQPKSSFDIRDMMDKGKIFIINLSKGRMGESNANLLGGMLITKIYLAALSRADTPDRILKTLPNFYLYVDEFQSFANESFADILSEARKYKLNLTIAHQYIEQMEEEVRAAVFGNVGTMIVFRVGAYDAEVLEKEFAPQFTAEDLVNLGIYQIYLKLMIDGISSNPFSAVTLPPIAKPENSSMQAVIDMSRKQYARNREEVERNIADWHIPIKSAQKRVEHLHINDHHNQTHSHVNPHEHHTKPHTISHPNQHPNSNPNPIANPVPEQQFKKAFQESKIDLPKNEQKIDEQNKKENIQKTIIDQKVKPSEIKEIKPVSLENLKPKDTYNVNNNQKEANPQRVNELKNALASVLAANKVEKKVEQVDDKKIIKKEEEKNIAKIESKNSQQTEEKPQIKEIPEHVLKDILKVE